MSETFRIRIGRLQRSSLHIRQITFLAVDPRSRCSVYGQMQDDVKKHTRPKMLRMWLSPHAKWQVKRQQHPRSQVPSYSNDRRYWTPSRRTKLYVAIAIP